MPVNVLIFEGEREKTQQFFETVAAENRVNFIGVGGQDGGTIEGMQALARGEVVAILGDRTLNANEKNTVRVPFLGKEALFPIGPHLMAALSSAPILHVFAMRTRLYHYRYFIYPAEELQLGNRSMRYEQLTQWATVLVKRIETLLKQYPLQWYNFYEVWDE